MSEEFQLAMPQLMSAKRARDIARGHKALADHFEALGERAEAAKAERQSAWWLAYAVALSQIPPGASEGW